MPRDQGVQAAAQKLWIEAAEAMDGDGFVVERQIGRHRRMQPDIELLGGERHDIIWSPAGDALGRRTRGIGIARQQRLEQPPAVVGYGENVVHGRRAA